MNTQSQSSFIHIQMNKIISKFLSQMSETGSGSCQCELEIRFGKFKDRQFISQVDFNFFHRFKKILEKTTKKQTLFTTETIYQNEKTGQSIKKISDNEESKFISKKNVEKFDNYDFDFRVNLALEEVIEEPNLEEFKQIMIREKSRDSFLFETEISSMRYDFTEVKVDNNDRVIYELELEIKSATDANSVISAIAGIIQTRQQNYNITSNTIQKKILTNYKELIKNQNFIGAQAETLHISSFPKLYREHYAVTDKADGERAFLFINESGNLYFINSSLSQVKDTGLKTNLFYSTLLDGEIIDGNQIGFYAFDILFFNGNDLRGNDKFLLGDRLDLVKQVITSIKNSPYLFCIKNYIFYNVFLGSKLILDSEKSFPYSLDGLIFTPLNEPYPRSRKWSSLLKWKPVELTTVDFYAEKESETTDVWKLYTRKLNEAKKLVLEVFQIPIKETPDQLIGTTTTFSSDLIDPTTDQPFRSNTVIEFKYLKEEQKWFPIRTRTDKIDRLGNPMPNFYTIALDIWKAIHFPVTREYLTNFNYTVFYNTHFKYANLRTFHNKVKTRLYNSKGKTLLELCSGKGGDLHKWIHNDIKKVIGYDISSQSVTECYKRISQMKPKTSMDLSNYTFNVLDLSKKENLEKIAIPDVDTVSCQFGLHYFWDSEEKIREVLKCISRNLKRDGFFIGTIIDDSTLNHWLPKDSQTHCIISDSREIVYYLSKKTFKNNFSTQLEMYLAGNNYLSSMSKEYIINFDKLVELAKEYSLELKESVPFSNEKGFESLEEYEKHISHLYRSFVFQKTGGESQTVSVTPKKRVPTVFSSDLEDIKLAKPIDIDNGEIKISFVENNLQLVRLLNVYNYTYDYLSIPKAPITLDFLKTLSHTNFVVIKESETYDITNNPLEKRKVVLKCELDLSRSEDNEVSVESWYIYMFKNDIGDYQFFVKNVKESTFTDVVGRRQGTFTDVVDRQQGTLENLPQNDSVGKDTPEPLDLEKMSLKDLKTLCKERGLKVTGKKSELIARIR